MRDDELLPRVPVTPKTGDEPFRTPGGDAGFALRDFWRWAASDLVGNAWRGVLAEFLVARALGVDGGVRVEWDAVDVRTREGIAVEVKSAAYLQSWAQRELSAIRFGIGPTQTWDPDTGRIVEARVRSADVYVFCLLAHQDPATVDPLDVTQWRFFVLPTRAIDAAMPAQKTLGLASLLAFGPVEVPFAGIAGAVNAAAPANLLAPAPEV